MHPAPPRAAIETGWLRRVAAAPGAATAVGVAALIVVVLIHLPTLGQPLLEAHAFRQTQTAFTALLFHQQGIDLLHPMLPVLGAPWEVPLEFPLFQALASLVMDLGVGPDAATRFMGLISFVASAWLVWLLVRRVAGTRAGLIGLTLFLFTPLALLWSRTALIEYLATALALGYVLLAVRWLDDERPRVSWAAAVSLGALAMMVKITTGVLYLIPVLVIGIIVLHQRRTAGSLRPTAVLALVLIIAIPTGMGTLWTHHADAIKAASLFTVPFTSGNLIDWNFGTLAQKTSLAAWADFLGRTNTLVFGGLLPVWATLALAGGFRSPRWGMALSSVLAVVAAPTVFTNLYFVHDYYLTAISPFVAVGFAIGVTWLWDHAWRVGRQRLTGPMIVAIGAVLWVAGLILSFSYWGVQYRGVVDSEGALVAAETIDRTTAPGDLVVVTGRDWSPAALYYARRWGLMWRDTLASATTDANLRRFRDLGYVKLFDCPYGTGCAVADLLEPRPVILEQLGSQR